MTYTNKPETNNHLKSFTSMNEITFSSVRGAASDLSNSAWSAVFRMLYALSDEEIEKIPSLLNMPDVRDIAVRYGISDIISRGDKWIYVYCISGYIFKGETKLNPYINDQKEK